jgi:hypothetical protein
MSDFNDPGAPGGGDSVPLADLLGALLLFDVIEETATIQTVHGPSTAMRCNVAVLDGEHKGRTYDDSLIFPRVLKSQLKPSVGGKVLGRLGQGEKVAGKTPAWLLHAATDADRETGRKYLAYLATKTPEPEEAF